MRGGGGGGLEIDSPQALTPLLPLWYHRYFEMRGEGVEGEVREGVEGGDGKTWTHDRPRMIDFLPGKPLVQFHFEFHKQLYI